MSEISNTVSAVPVRDISLSQKAKEQLNKEVTLLGKFRWIEFFIEKSILVTAGISILFTILILIFIFRESIPIFTSPIVREEASFRNLMQTIWQPVSDLPKYGLIPLLVGTFKVTLVAILFATPVAILAAVYTSAFAPKWAKEFIKPAIEILAGFPSVVIGFFALMILASWIQNVTGSMYRLNALVGGIAMSLAVIPIIYTISEDSLTAVPKSLSEASLALGASQWQTAFYVVLPAAYPGIFAGIILGMGRAFGETMIALMATGNASIVSANIMHPVRTLSATIGAEMAEVVFGDTHYNVLFLIGAIMFVVTFTFNAITELYIKRKLMERFKGAS